MLLRPLTAMLLVLAASPPRALEGQHRTETLTVAISRVDPIESTITVKGEMSGETTYRVDGYTRISIDGRDAALEDLKAGSIAMVQVSASRLLAIHV